MLTTINRIVNKLENQPLGIVTWILTFFSIIIIRLLLEVFAYLNGIPFDLLSFVHGILFFSAPMLTLTIIVYLFTKENLVKISKVFLFGWMISWIPPIVDLIIDKGKGTTLTYLFTSLGDLPYRFVIFFGSTVETGVTIGAKVMIISICVSLALFIFLKTKSAVKSVVSIPLAYIVIFFYVSLPSILAAIVKGSANLSHGEVVAAMTIPHEVFAIKRYYLTNFFDFELSLALFPIVIGQLFLYLFFLRRDQFVALIKNVRISRLFLQIVALGSGLYLGMKLTGTPLDLSLFGVLSIICLFFTVFFAWLFSIGINDIYDFNIDRISNPKRPLIKNIVSIKEYTGFSIIFFLLSVIGAFILGERYLVVILTLNGLSFIYSAPPLRLRRFPIVTTLVIASGILLAILTGYMLFSEHQSLIDFPINITFLILAFFTLVSTVKDLKDYEGDKANEVYTIPTLFGLKRSKIIIGILVFVSFLLFPLLFLNSFLLFLISLGFGIISFLLIYDKSFKEQYLFALFSLFLLLIFVLTY